MRALVLLNGDLRMDWWGRTPETAGPWDRVICADGGGRYARLLGLRPDVLVGDFDSLSPADRLHIKAGCIRTHPRAKDQTDAELAVREALAGHGAGGNVAGGRVIEVTLAAAFGGRIDHTLGNIGLLHWLSMQGASGVATDGRQSAWLVTSDTSPLVVHGEVGTVVSVAAYGACARGVSLAGMRWPLANAVLQLGECRGISNEMIATSATVAVQSGELLVIVNRERIE